MITVVCNDAAHARGKVATIATFVATDTGAWTYGPRRRRADTAALFRCKLCQRALPGWAQERRVLFAVLNWLAAHGCDEVSLTKLIELASKVET